MPDTPPEIGSLWLHESGERRFVINVKPDGWILFTQLHPETGQLFNQYRDLEQWLAWAANARRIDSNGTQRSN